MGKNKNKITSINHQHQQQPETASKWHRRVQVLCLVATVVPAVTIFRNVSLYKDVISPVVDRNASTGDFRLAQPWDLEAFHEVFLLDGVRYRE
jgi:hypothetical protein